MFAGLLFKERRVLITHRGDQQRSIKKQIAHLAARFGDQQATMASSTMGGSISTAVVWFMVGAHRVIRADPQSVHRTLQNV